MNGTTTPANSTGSSPASMAPMSAVAVIALVLLVLGGLNWALVGLFHIDLVAAFLGEMSPLTRLVYILIGLSALVVIGLFPRLTRD